MRIVRVLLLALAASAVSAPASHAQTLAHRNWQGSGMVAQPWWRGAVLYRIEAPSFQDTTGSGTGDLKGIAERMSYLRALGIDAIVLEPPFDAQDSAGFDALLTAASGSRIRIIVGVQLAASVNPVAEGRAWLSRGAAGVELSLPATSSANAAALSDALTALHGAARQYPGERVIMARVDATTAAALRAQRGAGADLLAVDVDSVARTDNSPASLAVSLRQSLLAMPSGAAQPASMLLSDDALRSASVFAPSPLNSDPARALGLNAAMAAVLLASQPGAVSLLYGQELGLESTDATVRMQWTPANVTPPGWKPQDNRELEEAEDQAARPAPAPPPPKYDPGVYGSYHPYVAPKKPEGPAPFDPNALRGFSSKGGSAFVTASVDATRSAALEERDQGSLLNFYRRLIALHHDDPVLRSGSLHVFDHSAQNALAWAVLPPPGVITARAVVVVCNLGNAPLTLSLDDDLRSLHLRPSALRRLASSPSSLFETTSRVTLPAHGVYVGELYR
jgi:hypothetical protein